MPETTTQAELPLTCTCDHCEEVTPANTTHDVEHYGEHQTWCGECTDSHATVCHDCPDIVSDDNPPMLGGEVYCQSCFDAASVSCARCDALVHQDSTTRVQSRGGAGATNSVWCDDCVENHACRCDNCSALVPGSTIVDVDGEDWCQSCYEEDSFSCEDCGNLFPSSDAHHDYDATYCGSCYSNRATDDDDDDEVRPRHTHKGNVQFIRTGWIPSKPPTRYVGLRHIKPPCCNNRTCPTRTVSGEVVPARVEKASDPFFGVENEVEVSSGTSLGEVVRHMRQQLGVLYGEAESDGSLNRGIEFVTNAGTLQAHRDAWLAYTPHRATRAHDTNTCGLHVHVSRYAFSRLTWHKFVTLTHGDDAVPHLNRLFRRALGGQWIDKNSIAKGDKAKCARRGAVNFLNQHTVEIRWPKGTTKGATIVATVELIHALLRYCEVTSLQGLSWEGFNTMIHDEDCWLFDETESCRKYMSQRLND